MTDPEQLDFLDEPTVEGVKGELLQACRVAEKMLRHYDQSAIVPTLTMKDGRQAHHVIAQLMAAIERAGGNA